MHKRKYDGMHIEAGCSDWQWYECFVRIAAEEIPCTSCNNQYSYVIFPCTEFHLSPITRFKIEEFCS